MARIVCGEAQQAAADGVAIYPDGAGRPEWSGLLPVRVGAASSGEPDAIVVLQGPPARRFDIHCHRPAPMFTFEAKLWAGWLVIGFGDRVTLVALDDGRQCEHRLDSYFSQLHATGGALLALSGMGIARLDREGRAVWQRSGLGIDGVIIREIKDGAIRGEGEWDPPGGWRPFALNFETGKLLEPI